MVNLLGKIVSMYPVSLRATRLCIATFLYEDFQLS